MISEQERAAYERFALPMALCTLADGKIRAELVSDGFCESFGLSRGDMHELLRGGMYEYTHPDDMAMLMTNTDDFLSRRRDTLDVVFRTRRSPGEDYIMVHTVSRWQRMADGSEYAMLVYCDMSATESSIARLFTQFAIEQDDPIYTDPVTGLKNFNYNRQFSMDIAGRIRAEGETPMYMIVDIKDMQGYNTNYGYTNGDKLFRVIAEELVRGLGSPSGVVIRGTDDNFFILDAFPGEAALAAACTAVNERIRKRAYGFTSGVRAGVCVLGPKTRTTTAMDRARTALREIGDDRNVTYRIYSTEKDEVYWFRRYITDNFDRALAEGWIRVFYQPIRRIGNRKMTALESLARWIDPSRGLVPPDDFIPLLSRFHQTYRLDLYIVEQICRDFGVRAKEDLPLLPVSVNFSAQDFDHADIPAALDEILGRYGIDPGYLIIEITEQDLALGTEAFHAQLDQLRARGYTLWIDDFGSGYSSLNVFSRYSVDCIKFDMELLRHLDDRGGANREILRAFVGVCRSMGIHTLCEGVETEAQYAFLKEIGCELAQGFLFAQPKPIEDAIFKRRHVGPAKHWETEEERKAENAAWLAGGKAE